MRLASHLPSYMTATFIFYIITLSAPVQAEGVPGASNSWLKRSLIDIGFVPGMSGAGVGSAGAGGDVVAVGASAGTGTIFSTGSSTGQSKTLILSLGSSGIITPGAQRAWEGKFSI
jgi:hypothetical protein